MAIYLSVKESGIYFITFTCYNWLPLIEMVNGYDEVYDWFEILDQKGHSITGYVIMPNHLHLLLYYSGIGASINTVIGNAKRFMAYEIVKRLELKGETRLLKYLQEAVEFKDRKRGKKHEVWEDSFDVKECRTEKFILQKLQYIHNNPCAGKWNLAGSPELYPHSSALFYDNGDTGYCPFIKDYRDLLY